MLDHREARENVKVAYMVADAVLTGVLAVGSEWLFPTRARARACERAAAIDRATAAAAALRGTRPACSPGCYTEENWLPPEDCVVREGDLDRAPRRYGTYDNGDVWVLLGSEGSESGDGGDGGDGDDRSSGGKSRGRRKSSDAATTGRAGVRRSETPGPYLAATLAATLAAAGRRRALRQPPPPSLPTPVDPSSALQQQQQQQQEQQQQPHQQQQQPQSQSQLRHRQPQDSAYIHPGNAVTHMDSHINNKMNMLDEEYNRESTTPERRAEISRRMRQYQSAFQAWRANHEAQRMKRQKARELELQQRQQQEQRQQRKQEEADPNQSHQYGYHQQRRYQNPWYSQQQQPRPLPHPRPQPPSAPPPRHLPDRVKSTIGKANPTRFLRRDDRQPADDDEDLDEIQDVWEDAREYQPPAMPEDTGDDDGDEIDIDRCGGPTAWMCTPCVRKPAKALVAIAAAAAASASASASAAASAAASGDRSSRRSTTTTTSETTRLMDRMVTANGDIELMPTTTRRTDPAVTTATKTATGRAWNGYADDSES